MRTDLRTPPPPIRYGPLTLPNTAQAELPGGLTVLATRRSIPLVDLRLAVPMGCAPPATAALLAEAMVCPTGGRPNIESQGGLQDVGGQLVTTVNSDTLVVTGSVLAQGTDRLLDVLAEVLMNPRYDHRSVEPVRARLAEAMRVSRTQPAISVHEHLNRRIYPGHPYSWPVPTTSEILSVETMMLGELHRERIRPEGSTLVLVGDFDPEDALEAADKALAGWRPSGTGPVLMPMADPIWPCPLHLVHSKGAVQSSIRIAADAVDVRHPDFAALQLANLVFGGYFSSRLVANLREQNGFTYTPRSALLHTKAASRLIVSFDVASEVTADALAQTWRELEIISSAQIDPAELEQARRHALGTQRLAVSSQSGIADLMLELAVQGVGLDWVAEHIQRLEQLTAAEVSAVAARYLDPERTATVVLGDAEVVRSGLSDLNGSSHT